MMMMMNFWVKTNKLFAKQFYQKYHTVVDSTYFYDIAVAKNTYNGKCQTCFCLYIYNNFELSKSISNLLMKIELVNAAKAQKWKQLP